MSLTVRVTTRVPSALVAVAKSNIAVAITRDGQSSTSKKRVLIRTSAGALAGLDFNSSASSSQKFAKDSVSFVVEVGDITLPEAGAVRFAPLSADNSFVLDLKNTPTTELAEGTPFPVVAKTQGAAFPAGGFVGIGVVRIRFRVTVNGVVTSSAKRVAVYAPAADDYVATAVAVAPTGGLAEVSLSNTYGLARLKVVASDGTLGAVRWITVTKDTIITIDLISTDVGATSSEKRASLPTGIGSGGLVKVKAAGFVAPALRSVTVRMTRNGEQTPQPKTVKIYADQTATVLLSLFYLQDGYEQTLLFSQAIDGDRFAQAIDTTAPKLGALRWPTINQSLILLFNVADDDGSGGGGVTTTLDTTVRVDGLPASRDVVGLEKTDDGKWRLSGFGTTDTDGAAELTLKVIPSSTVYAMAISDFGVPFQASTAVALGALIRPTDFKGWLYQVTQAGSLPTVEPEWWDENTIGAQPVGTALATVVRYYRPLAHGPIPLVFT